MKPTLKGPRLTFRPLKISDAPNYVRWFNDKKVVKYLIMQTGITLAEEKKYLKKIIADKNNHNFAMINEVGKHIGSAGVNLLPEHKRATFGIVIGDKNEWGKKYAQEAIVVFMKYVFEKLKYNRFQLEVYTDNKPAVHVYEKMGLKTEGIRRKYSYNKVTKRLEDEAIMAILREDWLKMKKRLTK